MARRKQEQMERLRGAFGFADEVRLELARGWVVGQQFMNTTAESNDQQDTLHGAPCKLVGPHLAVSPILTPPHLQVKEGDAFNRELQEQKRLERIAEREAQEKERK